MDAYHGGEWMLIDDGHAPNDANTKCDASTKYTARLPPRVSTNLGSNSTF
jgi:hypothetical protein